MKYLDVKNPRILIICASVVFIILGVMLSFKFGLIKADSNPTIINSAKIYYCREGDSSSVCQMNTSQKFSLARLVNKGRYTYTTSSNIVNVALIKIKRFKK